MTRVAASAVTARLQVRACRPPAPCAVVGGRAVAVETVRGVRCSGGSPRRRARRGRPPTPLRRPRRPPRRRRTVSISRQFSSERRRTASPRVALSLAALSQLRQAPVLVARTGAQAPRSDVVGWQTRHWCSLREARRAAPASVPGRSVAARVRSATIAGAGSALVHDHVRGESHLVGDRLASGVDGPPCSSRPAQHRLCGATAPARDPAPSGPGGASYRVGDQ